MESVEKILKAESITHFFGGLKALDSVSFGVLEGEIFGIVGPNGAGKTTLFNAISGVIKPTEGRLYFKNIDITGLRPFALAKLGIGRTFQVVRPFSSLTVLENVAVAYGVRFYPNFIKLFYKWKSKVNVKSVEEILDRVELIDFKNRLAIELPLGFQRRLEIARALALNPKMILLDESFSGLSFSEIDQLKGLVERVNRSGVTVVIIEHNMPVVMDICRRVMVINYGKKIAEGLPRDVVRDKGVIEAYLGRKYH